MSDSFKDREQQAEARFAHDEEVAFKIRAHRNALFAAWVVEQMGAGAPSDYAQTLRDFALDHAAPAIVERARQDLENRGLVVSDIRLQKAFEHCEAQARTDVLTEIPAPGA
jgi:hypothetical protein